MHEPQYICLHCTAMTLHDRSSLRNSAPCTSHHRPTGEFVPCWATACLSAPRARVRNANGRLNGSNKRAHTGGCKPGGRKAPLLLMCAHLHPLRVLCRGRQGVMCARLRYPGLYNNLAGMNSCAPYQGAVCARLSKPHLHLTSRTVGSLLPVGDP